MTREDFLRELAYMLQDVAEEEREEARAYYRDYLEDAGPEAWSRLEAAVERAGQLLTGKAEPSRAYLEETIAQLTDALAAVPAAE